MLNPLLELNPGFVGVFVVLHLNPVFQVPVTHFQLKC